MFLLNGDPSGTHSELSFVLTLGLPEYYLNQDDEWTLPQPLQPKKVPSEELKNLSYTVMH